MNSIPNSAAVAVAHGSIPHLRPSRMRLALKSAVDRLTRADGCRDTADKLCTVICLAVTTISEAHWVLQTFVDVSQDKRASVVLNIDGDSASENVLDHAHHLMGEACTALDKASLYASLPAHVADPLWCSAFVQNLWRARSVLAMIISIVSVEEESSYWPRIEFGLCSLIDSLDSYIDDGNDACTTITELLMSMPPDTSDGPKNTPEVAPVAMKRKTSRSAAKEAA